MMAHTAAMNRNTGPDVHALKHKAGTEIIPFIKLLIVSFMNINKKYTRTAFRFNWNLVISEFEINRLKLDMQRHSSSPNVTPEEQELINFLIFLFI